MLLELTIRDFAIIDTLRLSFGAGLNVLTGETGAGKSIIVDALGAVLGDRIGAEFVRSGRPQAQVEGLFDVAGGLSEALAAILGEQGIEPEEGCLILRRDIHASGRSVARINGRTVTTAILQHVGQLLVDIHGQSDHLSLLRPAGHIDLLDQYAGLLDERLALAGQVTELRRLRAELAGLERDERDLAQRVDLLTYQIAEIEEADPRLAEEEEHELERRRLSNAEKLSQLAEGAYRSLAGTGDRATGRGQRGVIDVLREAANQLTELARLDEAQQKLAESVTEVLYLLEEAARDLRAYREGVEHDPARLEMLDDRLHLLRDLRRKYGATIEEVLAYAKQAASELEGLVHREERVAELRRQEAQQLAAIGAAAAALSQARQAAGAELAAAVEQSIRELNMGRTRFQVSLSVQTDPAGVPLPEADSSAIGQRLPSTGRAPAAGGRAPSPTAAGAPADGDEAVRYAFDARGIDHVEFLISPNPGEPLKPLARIASGGETARLMLALKSILAAVDATPTLVFDEVDVGVGGRSGQVVGEKLWGLTRHNAHQVICITHLPQIAAFAEAHFKISKLQADDRTSTTVGQIDGLVRVEELAAMMGGLPVTPQALANAAEMLERIRHWQSLQSTPPVSLASHP